MEIDNKKCFVRPAIKTDVRRVWEIRNHPLVRQNSNNSDEIDFVKHEPWFLNKYFVSQGNYCFVLDYQNQAVGYCRIDFNKDSDNFTISIALDPEYHSKGLGSLLLSESLRLFLENKEILAEIKRENIPSIKLFEKNGFKTFNEDDVNYYLKYRNDRAS